MRNSSIRYPPDLPASSWSNRILLLATAGILFLTMYPFRFSFHLLPHGASPFVLGKSVKRASYMDAVLNVMLFVPFGFGLAAKLRERGKSTLVILITALATGAVFSYAIEFLQLYIPERDSGWEDVFTNGSGSLLGGVLYWLFGTFLFRLFTSTQQYFAERWSMKHLVIALLTYFCIWIGFAAQMQKQTRLSDWNPNAMLVLGNDGSGDEPWVGQIRTLQIWDRAPNANAVFPNAAPMVNYDFSTPVDGSSKLKFVPSLFWIPRAPLKPIAEGNLAFDGKSWVSTKTNVGPLIYKLQGTNQITIHIVFKPEKGAIVFGRIFSVSDSAGAANLTLRQEKSSIALWFRTPLSMKQAQLEWRIPPSNENLQRDLIFIYDGANVLITVDGKTLDLPYPLGPGAAMARTFRRIKPPELEGYNYTFYAFVFFVGGAAFGLLRPRNLPTMKANASVTVLVALLSVAFILEFVLASVSGRALTFSYVALSFLLGIAGSVWARADGPFVTLGGAR